MRLFERVTGYDCIGDVEEAWEDRLVVFSQCVFNRLGGVMVKALLHGKASIAILVSCIFLYHDPCQFTH